MFSSIFKRTLIAFAFVMLFSFAYSLPIPPPAPSIGGSVNSTYNDSNVSSVSSEGSLLNNIKGFLYSSESSFKYKTFFFLALFIFFVLLAIICFIIIKRKKDLLTKESLSKNDKK